MTALIRNTHDRKNDHHGADLDSNVGLDGGLDQFASATDLHTVLEAILFGGLFPIDDSSAWTISPTTLSANTNNWNPTGLAQARWIRAQSNASRDLTGIVAPSNQPRAVLMTNVGSNNIVLKHDATSTSGNRFFLPGSVDYTLTPNSSVLLFYDPSSGRWRALT